MLLPAFPGRSSTTDRDAAIAVALSELAGQAAPAATRSDGNTPKAAGRAKRTPSYSGARSSGGRDTESVVDGPGLDRNAP